MRTEVFQSHMGASLKAQIHWVSVALISAAKSNKSCMKWIDKWWAEMVRWCAMKHPEQEQVFLNS